MPTIWRKVMLELEMRNITKKFPGVLALENVSLEVERGSIHGLVGENGAGKSTLIKILSGAYIADTGKIIFENTEIVHPTPLSMIDKGIAVIYQELMLLKHATVAENIYLGRQPRKNGFIDYVKMKKDAADILEKLDLPLNPCTKVDSLSIACRQMVEIAKAMSKNAKLIVLDEPTAVLSEKELDGLFHLVKQLSGQGVSFIYISHRLKEIFDLCTDLTILKDGRVVEHGKTEDYTIDKLVCKMVGRDMKNIYPKRTVAPRNEEVLRVSNLERKGSFHNVSFSLKRGEILGFAGLAGSGRTEVMRAIMGIDPVDQGEIYHEGEKVTFKNPQEAIKDGFGLVPEDRKNQGLFLKQNMIFNAGIAALKSFMRSYVINIGKEKDNALKYISELHVHPESPHVIVSSMSGGNQQKIVLAKSLATGCKILIVDEPTRGVDVGAKQEIYSIFNDLVQKEGLSILMVSSELPEVLGMCDRILVMNEGTVAGIVNANMATEESLMALATRNTIRICFK